MFVFLQIFYISGLIEKLMVPCNGKACTLCEVSAGENGDSHRGEQYTGKRVLDTQFFWGLFIGYWVSVRSSHSLPHDKSPWEGAGVGMVSKS